MAEPPPDPAALLPSPRHLLATILPSANTVVERSTIAMLGGLPVAPLFTRMAKRGATDPFPDRHDTDALL
jgi:hypothetical protein